MVSDGVSNKFRAGRDTQNTHDPVLVKGHGTDCHAQDTADFLHHFSFGQQLQDFALPLGQPLAFFYVFLVLPPQIADSLFGESL